MTPNKSNTAPATVIGEIHSTTAKSLFKRNRGKGMGWVLVLIVLSMIAAIHTISPETGLMFLHINVAVGDTV